MRLQSHLQTQSGKYDFAFSGGAVGTFLLGTHLPKFSTILNFWVTSFVVPTSGGAATISFGSQDLIAPLTDVDGYMVANAFGAFLLQTPLQGVDMMANPIKQLNPTQVVMAIGGADLTAGELQYNILYIEQDR